MRRRYTPGTAESCPQPELGGALHCAALACGGVVLAVLAVYAGTGLHDGFGDWDLHRLGRRFRRALLWTVPLAAAAGVQLHADYARLSRPGPSGWVISWSIVRAVAHFPRYGGLALGALMWGFAESAGRRVLRRWRHDVAGPVDSDSILERWLGPPLWFMFLPFIALNLPLQGDVEIPKTVSRRRLLRWPPGILAVLLLYTGAVSEETGDRVDPCWLAAIAAT